MSDNNGGRETLFSRARREIIGPCCLALLFCGLTYWSWRKWPDILVDFGREVYVPWQLASGSVLYRDIAYLNGPLSPYFNSLWFRLFGVSLSAIIYVNLFLLAALTALLYTFLRRSIDRLAATLSCAVFLSIFGFAHFTMTGNYNFVCPYSHELTHGLLLGTVMILMLVRSFERPNRGNISVAGCCLGLSFLTKPEVFFATLPAALVGLYYVRTACGKTGQRHVPAVGAFWTATLIPIAVAFTFLSTGLPTFHALQGVAGGWPHLFRPGLIESPFYQVTTGLDAPWANLLVMGRGFAGFFLFVAAVAAWSLDAATLRGKRLVCVAVSVLLLALALLTKTSPVPWLLSAEAVPIITLLGGLLLVTMRKTDGEEQTTSPKTAALLMWATFAFFLLVKIIFHPHFHHYGFALAAPAAVLIVVLLTSTLPGLPRLPRGVRMRSRVFRFLITCFIVFDLGYYVLLSDEAYGRKNYVVGSGRDYVVTYDPAYDSRGPAINRLLERIEQTIPRKASLLVLPEGVMVNYLARRTNPTPYVTFMPPELAIYGEPSMLETIQNDPPDFIVLASKDMEEYGVGPFGKDPAYGSLMMTWVSAHYETIWQIVGKPGRPGQFGAELLRRRAP